MWPTCLVALKRELLELGNCDLERFEYAAKSCLTGSVRRYGDLFEEIPTIGVVEVSH